MKQALNILFAGLFAFASPSLVASDTGPLVEIEVLDGGLTARGTYMGALRLTLQAGWKTYWRSPGDAGIPPSFDWRGSRNVGALAIIWPTPEVTVTSGYQTIGYHDQLVLPIEITPNTPNAPVTLAGEMQLGLCKDICVPSEVTFDHQLNLQADRNPSIAAAMANRPYTAKEAGVRSAKCRLSPTKYGMQVVAHIAMPTSGGTEVAVIESGTPLAVGGATATERRGNTLVATTEFLPASNDGFALDRSKLRITVLGSRHAVDIRGCAAG